MAHHTASDRLQPTGYRFNPNKGRKGKAASAKTRSPGKSPRRTPAGSVTPASSSAPSPARSVLPSSAPPAAGAFQLSVLAPETMDSWGAHASSTSSHSLSSLSMATTPSLQSQLDAIFPHDQVAQMSYPTSSAGSYQSSPPWTGGLMPALSIGEAALSSSCPSPSTPLTDYDQSTLAHCSSSLPSDTFAQYAVDPSSSYSTSHYTFPEVQPIPSAHLVQTTAVELDWWNFRGVKVSLDDSGVPLEELLFNLQQQQQQSQYYVREQ